MTEIKTKFFEGLGNIGKAFPVIGTVIGTKLVFKSVKGLKKPTKKILKGGYKI
jgi:hypothetical protein